MSNNSAVCYITSLYLWNLTRVNSWIWLKKKDISTGSLMESIAPGKGQLVFHLKKRKKCLEKETWWMVIKCCRRRKRGDIYLPATASLFIFLIGDVITSWVTDRASITHCKRYNGPRPWCLNLFDIHTYIQHIIKTNLIGLTIEKGGFWYCRNWQCGSPTTFHQEYLLRLMPHTL